VTSSTPREVTYQPWLPTFEPLLGKVVRTTDVPAVPLARQSGNPHDEGTDWGLLGPWINGAAEFSVGVFTMEPNQTHPPHYHPIGPEFYYIAAGSCLVQVDDEMIEAGPEMAIYLPEGTVHAVWTRDGESVTIVYGFDERPDTRVTTVWLE
jgi:quercetin dioxygenase-like cupin family protein